MRLLEPIGPTTYRDGCNEEVPKLSAADGNALENVSEGISNSRDVSSTSLSKPLQSQIAQPNVDLLLPDFSDLSLILAHIFF